MGKSTKTSSSKVDAAVVDAAPTKHWKKGKREAEDDIEKPLVSAKKQKLEEKKTEVVKKVKQSSSDDDSSSESEQPKVKASAKNGGLVAFTNKKVESSSDSSSSDDNVTAVKKVPATQTKKPVPATQKKVESSDESSSEEETSSDDNVTEAKKIPVVASQKKVSSSSDGSSSDEETSSDDNVSAPKKVPSANVAVTQNKVESSSDSDDETSSDDNVTAAKKVPEATKRKAESSSDNSDSEDETDSGDNVTTGKKVPAVADIKKKGESSSDETESDSDSEDETSKKSNAKVQAKSKAGAEEESADDSSEESDDEPQKKKLKPSGTINAVKTSLKVDAEESSFEEESTDDDKPSKMQGVTKEKPSITPKKKDTDVKMTDVEKTQMKAGKNGSPFENTPKTPTNPKGQTGSKTVFVANLSYSVEQPDVEKFFKVAGKVIDVHFGMNADNTFKGFSHVQFASPEAAQKAVRELNGKELLGRPVRLDLAREKGAYTPYSGGKDTESYQKGGREQWHQLYIRGFNKDGGEEEIKNSLREHFGSCGEIARINLPVDQEGGIKGFGYISFRDRNALNKGLELNGSVLGGNTLYLEEARPKEGRGSGKSGERDSAGRNGADRGRGRGTTPNRGRGTTPSRPFMATAGTGKKTTFNDDD